MELELIKTVETVIETLLASVNKLINNAPHDKTFCAQITGISDNGKYETLYKGKKYTVTCNRALTVGTWVWVCAPQNNWNNLFVAGI